MCVNIEKYVNMKDFLLFSQKLHIILKKNMYVIWYGVL